MADFQRFSSLNTLATVVPVVADPVDRIQIRTKKPIVPCGEVWGREADFEYETQNSELNDDNTLSGPWGTAKLWADEPPTVRVDIDAVLDITREYVKKTVSLAVNERLFFQTGASVPTIDKCLCGWDCDRYCNTPDYDSRSTVLFKWCASLTIACCTHLRTSFTENLGRPHVWSNTRFRYWEFDLEFYPENERPGGNECFDPEKTPYLTGAPNSDVVNDYYPRAGAKSPSDPTFTAEHLKTQPVFVTPTVPWSLTFDTHKGTVRDAPWPEGLNNGHTTVAYDKFWRDQEDP